MDESNNAPEDPNGTYKQGNIPTITLLHETLNNRKKDDQPIQASSSEENFGIKDGHVSLSSESLGLQNTEMEHRPLQLPRIVTNLEPQRLSANLRTPNFLTPAESPAPVSASQMAAMSANSHYSSAQSSFSRLPSALKNGPSNMLTINSGTQKSTMNRSVSVVNFDTPDNDSPIQPSPTEPRIVDFALPESPESSYQSMEKIHLKGNTLYLFSRTNPFRKTCARFVTNKWFTRFITLLIFVNWLMYAVRVYPKGIEVSTDFVWQDYVILVIFLIYTLEIFMKSVAFGFYYEVKSDCSKQAHRPFLKGGFHVLDVVVVISYWIDLILMSSEVKGIYLFKAVSSIRAIRLLALTEGLEVILVAITSSAGLLRVVMIFLLFFYTIFGLMGYQFFSGSLRYRCVAVSNTNGTNLPVVTIADEIHSCGSWINPVTNESMPVRGKIKDSVPKGFTCPFGLECRIMDVTSYVPSGFNSYDNIFSSMFTLFQSVSEQGWSFTMYQTMDAEYGIAALYHVLVIFLLDLMMMNLLVAVIANTFADTRAEFEKRRTEREFEYPIRFFTPRQSIGSFFELKREKTPLQENISFWLRSRTYKIIVAVMVLCSLATLSAQSYNQKTSTTSLLQAFDSILSAFFAIDLILHLCSGPSVLKNLRKPTRILDCIMVAITCVYLFPSIYGTTAFRYLSIFQVLRIYKIYPFLPRIPHMMATAFSDIQSMLNAMLFFIMSLSIIATVGMQLYGGRFYFLDNNRPHPTFDSFPEAFITAFRTMVSDNWTDTVYYGMFAQNGSVFGYVTTAIFFIIAFVLAHIVLIDICVAVLLDNFELTEKDKYKEQFAQLITKLKESNNRSKENVFSRWNPYRYMKPSPDVLNVTSIPEKLRWRVPKVVFDKFMYVEEAENVEGVNSPDTSSPRSGFFKILAKFFDLKFEKTETLEKNVMLSQTNLDDSSAIYQLIRRHFGRLITEPKKLKKGIPSPETEVDDFQFGRSKEADLLDNFDESAAAVSEFKAAHPMYDTSLFLFRPDNSIRHFCKKILGKDQKKRKVNIFNIFIGIVVVLSTVFLALDTPLSRKENLDNALNLYANSNNISLSTIDYMNPPPDILAIMTQSEYLSQSFVVGELICALIFTAEFLLKIIADGFLFTPDAYLLNNWNVLDFVVLVAMWLGSTTRTVSSTGFPRFIRIIRALRPLRLVSQIPGLKKVLDIVLASGAQIFDSILLVLLFMVPFAVYGHVIFNQMFYSCNDRTVPSKIECVGFFVDESGVNSTRLWSNPKIYDFDDIGAALLALFEMIMEEGWLEIFYSGISIKGYDMQPQWPPSAWYNALYFLFWMLLGYVILRNLFIGVILRAFMLRKGTALLTIEQRRWVEVEHKMKLVKPSKKLEAPKDSSFKSWCYNLVKEKRGKFHKFITGVIISNVIVMCTEFESYEKLPDGSYKAVEPLIWSVYLREYLYLIFTMVYVFEFVVKFIGLGHQKWRQNFWHFYDLFTLCGLVPTVIARLSVLNGDNDNFYIISQLQKLFLDLVAFRLIHRIRVLDMFFKTIRAGFYALASSTGVIFLVYAIYALAAVEIFGLTKLGEATNDHVNFYTFPNGLLTFVAMTTGEKWNEIFHELMVETPNCIENPYTYLLSNCGSRTWGLLIFISFEVLMALILINLLIATIIDNFDYSIQPDSQYSIITMQDLASYKSAWSHFDPKGQGFIQISQLPAFLRKLEGKLGTVIYPDSFNVKSVAKKITVSRPRVPPMNDLTPKNASLRTDASQRTASHRRNFSLGSKGSKMNLNESQAERLFPTGRTFGEDKEFIEYINITELNLVIGTIDQAEIRRKRKIYNFIYQEAILNAVPGKGISFHRLLRILALKLVDADKVLKVEQMLAREQEIHEVNAALSIEKIKSVLLFYHFRRQYIKVMEQRAYARLGGVFGSAISMPTDMESTVSRSQPFLENSIVPQIIVQDDTSSVPFSFAERSGNFKLGTPSPSSSSQSASFNLSSISSRSKSVDEEYDDEYDERVMESVRNSSWFK